MHGDLLLAPAFIPHSHLYLAFGMQMSFTAGILAQAAWLCANEASVKTWYTEARQEEDNLTGLRLEISKLWSADKNLVIRGDNLQSPGINGLLPPSGQCWSNCCLTVLMHTNGCWAAELSHPSDLIFVPTARQKFYSILRHHWWTDAHCLLLTFTHRQLCILYYRCTHTPRHVHSPQMYSQTPTAPRDPAESDRWWRLYLLTCTPSLGHLCSSAPTARRQNTKKTHHQPEMRFSLCGFMHSMKVAWNALPLLRASL